MEDADQERGGGGGEVWAEPLVEDREEVDEGEEGEAAVAEPPVAAGGGELVLAVCGCVHGSLNAIYDQLRAIEDSQGVHADLLICCGDFQAVRWDRDMDAMKIKQKYRQAGDFPAYYSGARKAHVPTVFVGGNHEASRHLWELYYGGYVCDNIYYMGASGVLRFGGLRLAGLSGIYRDFNYHKEHSRKWPYDYGQLLSSFHIEKLRLLETPVDVLVTHDWPSTLRGAPAAAPPLRSDLADEMRRGVLGHPYGNALREVLRPRWWFGAHYHWPYAALWPGDESRGIPDCRFLGIDKPIPGRHCLQLLRLNGVDAGDRVLRWDREWLRVIRRTNDWILAPPPAMHAKWEFALDHDDSVVASLSEEELVVPSWDFAHLVSEEDADATLACADNPQTSRLLDLINVPNNVRLRLRSQYQPPRRVSPPPRAWQMRQPDDGPGLPAYVPFSMAAASEDPDEIEIDGDGGPGGSAGVGHAGLPPFPAKRSRATRDMFLPPPRRPGDGPGESEASTPALAP